MFEDTFWLPLIAALVALALAVGGRVRSAPPSIDMAARVAAVASGLLALAHWWQGHDSRWMVGGVLMLAAGGLSLARGRAFGIGALACGGLGASLLAVATLTAR